MATAEYRWVKAWCLMHNIERDGPAPRVGDIVTVGKQNGDTDYVEVGAVIEFDSNAGKRMARIYPKPNER